MLPFFSTPSRLATLVAAATSWHGTPFFANSCAKGVGVSCQFLAADLYREAGFADLSPPEVPMAHARFSPISLVEPWVDADSRFAPVTGVAEPGDLVGFRLGKAVHHVGIITSPGRFIHAIEGAGVRESLLSDATWRIRLARIWRPIE